MNVKQPYGKRYIFMYFLSGYNVLLFYLRFGSILQYIECVRFFGSVYFWKKDSCILIPLKKHCKPIF